mmetsp:Transcript_42787/g.84067  ORF Transcript_42787/g.84067 Transcript_42787/m.84067 type:complete len:373 (+) Transcript_42787:212-1330(+)
MLRVFALTVFHLILPVAVSNVFGDYGIAKTSISYQNSSFVAEYQVGSDATSFGITLLYDDCQTEYTSATQVVKFKNPSIPAIGPGPNNMYSTEIIVDTSKFESSPDLVFWAPGFGYSKGALKMCIKAQAYLGDISVTFHKERVQLSFDLTQNSFTVSDVGISAADYTMQQIDVNSIYQVSACRCNQTSYACDTQVSSLNQNDLLFVCLRPNSTDVSIANFDMKYTQAGEEDNYIVTMGNDGPETSFLSAVFHSGDEVRVVSRLLTDLFMAEEKSFNVEGNAHLTFENRTKTERHLANTGASSNRSLQDVADGDVSPFSMTVLLEQSTEFGTRPPYHDPSFHFRIVSGVGGCLVLSIAFILYKKNILYPGRRK